MKKNIMKSAIFILLFLIVISGLTILMLQKPTTDNLGFYEQRKNSIDVLYIGSSHTYCSISPLELYEEYGYTGYIRATACQRSWESYALLVESLKYQKPKVVVYEVMSSYHDQPQYEAFAREIYDTMRPGEGKAIGLLAEFENPETDKLSFIFPLFRYHERWKELGEKDFTYLFETDHIPNKGYAMFFENNPAPPDYDVDRFKADMEAKPVPERSAQYIRMMKALCDENGIQFVMFKAPTAYVPYWDVGMSKGTKALAEELGVLFIDYNMGENAIEIDWNSETSDGGNHLNHYGAMKVTPVFGKWLKEQFDLPDHRGDLAYASWDEHYRMYQQSIAENELQKTGNFEAYMELIKEYFVNDEDYLVMITGKKNFLNAMTENQIQKLVDIGDDLDYISDGEQGIDPNMFAVNGGKILYKKQTPDNIADTFFIKGHTVTIDCQNEASGDCCDVYIDGTSVSLNAMGLDVIIYEIKKQRILDSSFAKFDENGELKVYR